MNTYITNLKNRYATKVFDTTKKLTQEHLDLLKQAMILAPSSFGLQPYKFLVIEDKETREKLKAASWDQAQVTESSHFIVLCARTDMNEDAVTAYIKLIAQTRNMDMASLDTYDKLMKGFIQGLDNTNKLSWAQKQTYIVLGFLLDACAQNNIDACPMEGFDKDKYSEILDLKNKKLEATVCCAVGFRGDDKYATLPKVRLEEKDLFYTL